MSSWLEGLLSTLEVFDAVSERQFLAARLRFEASLPPAQPDVGLIPDAAAPSWRDKLRACSSRRLRGR